LPKKTCALARAAGADYLIALKANQPILLHAVQQLPTSSPPESTWTETERTRDRLTTRTVQVFPVPQDPPFTLWADLAALVIVDRSGFRRRKPFTETAYYITSHHASAEALAAVVRGHWQIENGLHWVKDVQMKEDACTTRAGQAPRNLALLRSIVITLYRRKGIRSLTTAFRRFAHDVRALCKLLE
jgi:predicted transposase YbfD/YdcC